LSRPGDGGVASVRPEFWAARRVFVTGHTGFKGSWLCLWLRAMSATVRGYALPPSTQPSLFEVARLADMMDSVIGDVRDLDALGGSIAEFRPDVVLHLAAQPLVRESYRDPVGTYATNVMGTVHVLEAVRRVPGVRAVVNVTSDKCYENREWVWGYRENEAMGGHDPYSSSKGCAELVTSAYRRSFFSAGAGATAAVASGRAGNVFGGGDWARDRLIPDCMRALFGGPPLHIRNPEAIRPWQHVLEPLSGYLLLAERLYEEGEAYAEGWNFGPPEEDARTVRWMCERLREEAGGGGEIGVEPSALHEAQALRLDCAKARSRLGWRPRLPLSEGLRLTLEWHRSHAAGADMREITLEQIRRYQNAGASA